MIFTYPPPFITFSFVKWVELECGCSRYIVLWADHFFSAQCVGLLDKFSMIADLDPVIIVELGTDTAIHECIGHFVPPTGPYTFHSPQAGMNMSNIL